MENNFNLTLKDVSKNVLLAGFAAKIRKLGDLIFIDLRNEGNIVQVLINNKNENIHKIAKNLGREDVIFIKGTVVKRKSINKLLPSGMIEIIVNELEVVSKANQLPFIIDEKTDALEPLRMRFRFLDFRRANVFNILKFRSEFNFLIREYFRKLNYLEVETPTLTKVTFGGADELKVLSKNHPNMEYGLAQSPQIYKQLLMYGGVSNYYQIARCYRDEDSRSDRQIEFTQLDIEKSFTSFEEIKSTIESLLNKLFIKLLNIELKLPFKKITYNDSINDFGTDKPDLRFENKIYDLDFIFDDKNKDDFKIKNQKLIGFFFPKILGKKYLEDLNSKFTKNKLKFLYLVFSKGKLIISNFKFDISKIENLKKFINDNKINLKDEFSLILSLENFSESLNITRKILGEIRIFLAKEFNLIDLNKFNFVWITNWPLFELSSKLKLGSMHNPFTALADSDLEKFDKLNPNTHSKEEFLKLKSKAYDIVLNGSEIGGGSIRITDHNIQKKVFSILGLDPKEIEDDFGFLLNSQKFGVPNHGGIALGLDRLISIMLKIDSIKEVIAFPKSSKGTDEMLGGPTKIKVYKK